MSSFCVLSPYVENAIMFPPLLRDKVVADLSENHQLRTNTQRTPAIGVRINSKQYWVAEWENIDDNISV